MAVTKGQTVLIEQAIFTSARTSRGDGYQLVATSRCLAEQDARELAAWGPSHGSLAAERDEGSSVNFHRLTSGTCCVSKTLAAGAEFSGRGGARVYTQFLLVPNEVFARFANNAFAVLRAAWAKGLLNVHQQMPAMLERSSLAGRSAVVDEGLLAQLADHWGPQRVGQMIAAASASGQVLLAGARKCETLLGGLINCFPIECRPEISFTTGLRPSPRRPFRIVPTELNAIEQRRATRQDGVTVIDLTCTEFSHDALHGWARYVADAIVGDELPRLVRQLQVPRPGLRLDQLDSLADELGTEPHGRKAVALPTSRAEKSSTRRVATSESCMLRTDVPAIKAKATGPAAEDSNKRESSARDCHRVPPATIGETGDASTRELFEQFDDAIFDAIGGSGDAIKRATDLWRRFTASLSADELAAAREQYLRYTLTLWEASECALRDPDKAIRAMEMLIALFEGQ